MNQKSGCIHPKNIGPANLMVCRTSPLSTLHPQNGYFLTIFILFLHPAPFFYQELFLQLSKLLLSKLGYQNLIIKNWVIKNWVIKK
ncbi:hypothetical protein [Yersinia kristensenii]|uniref:hypothetical protein n=1 Tax=Yersinia kristensenii TaxID=28152 RepID=UPI001124D1BA|nr:hypothetical protein [Yersinia kristensenii]